MSASLLERHTWKRAWNTAQYVIESHMRVFRPKTGDTQAQSLLRFPQPLPMILIGQRDEYSSRRSRGCVRGLSWEGEKEEGVAWRGVAWR